MTDDLRERILAYNRRQAARDTDLADLRGRFDQLRAAYEAVRAAPTFDRLRDFLVAVGEILKEVRR